MASTPKKPQCSPEYLATLRDCEFDAIDRYDKTLLTLTGGAFAVSFSFLKDILGPKPAHDVHLLTTAWVCWAFSLATTLFAFYCSQLLALNLEVAAKIEKGEPVTAHGVPKIYSDARTLVTEDCIRQHSNP